MNNLLVSCRSGHGQGIYAFNEKTKDFKKVFDPDIRGMCQFEDVLYAASNSISGVFKLSLPDFKILVSKPLGINAGGVRIVNGTVCVVDAEQDRVISLGKEELSINGFASLRSENGRRLLYNDLYYYDGDMYYSCFGGYPPTSKTGYITRNEDIIVSGLEQPHSVVVNNDIIYWCSSEEYKVGCLEMKKGFAQKRDLVQLPGYTRGLLIENNTMWVGQSKHRKRDESALCGLWRINLSNENRSFFELPAREVYGILRLKT